VVFQEVARLDVHTVYPFAEQVSPAANGNRLGLGNLTVAAGVADSRAKVDVPVLVA
jgi:hypothetical protein